MSGSWVDPLYLDGQILLTLAVARRARWGYAPLNGRMSLAMSSTDTSAAARRAVSAYERVAS